MTNRPSISVAMATFNGAKYITAQLTSIVEQQLLPKEIVICDDGSTDGTVDCIEAIASQYPRVIRFFQNPQRLGFVANFERAVSLCSGDLIVLSDQDDIWHPTKLSRMVVAIEANDAAALVVANAELVDSELHPQNRLLYSIEQLKLLEDRESDSTALRGLLVNGCTLGFRAKFRPYILPVVSQSWGHDHWIATMLCLVAPTETVAEPTMLYRRHPNSSGNNPRLERNLFRRVQYALTLKLQHTSTLAYETDVIQWQSLGSRLEVMRNASDSLVNPKRLENAIRIVKHRQKFAETRLHLRRQNRLFRLPHLIYLFALGRYHRNANGLAAFVKDLIV